MRLDYRKTLTIAGRKIGLLQAYLRRYDLSALHERRVIDRAVGLRVLGLGASLQVFSSTATACLAFGHDWLFDVQLSGTAVAVSLPTNIPPACRSMYEPHIVACFVILGSVTKFSWGESGFSTSCVLKPGAGDKPLWKLAHA